MINDLDEVLRQLLIREIPIKNGEVAIKFDQPRREWASRLTRPTVNLFLHDIRENTRLRGSQQWVVERRKDGTAVQRRTPVRMDLSYMITAWAKDPEDEHRLLARVLMSLLRYPTLPNDLLPETLRDQAVPIPLLVAQGEALESVAEVWSALDNEMRPSITLTATMAIDPYLVITTPLVRTRELRVVHKAGLVPLPEAVGPDVFWSVGGRLQTERPLEAISLTLVERGLEVPLQEEGRFTIGRLEAGEYTLAVRIGGREAKQYRIVVPAPDYVLEL